MLDTPRNGWSTIKIGGWSDRCSYLDDVPFMLLSALEEACRTGRLVSGKFDAEGYEYIIVFDMYETHIITETENGYKLVTVEITPAELAAEIIGDIRKDLSGWSSWIDYGDMSEHERREREEDLIILCRMLKKATEK